jgi:pimeloyl-ACP methyl ester carboxylesterase
VKDLFLISGLGADRRVFEFVDLSGYKLNFIDWIPPQPSESIEHYAERLLQQIPVKKPILIGVSFGGMMAVEIGKLIETEKIILISSAKNQSDLPWYFRLIGKLKLSRHFPATPPPSILFYAFGVKEKYEKELLVNIIRKTDPLFLNWALEKIFSWKNKSSLPDSVKIHGTNDKLFPNRKANYLIEDGGHFMIVNRANEIGALLKSIL